MRKVTELVAKPIAVVVLLALLGVSAHAAAILVFTSRDTFQSVVPGRSFEYNFSNPPALRSNAVNFDPVGQLTGDLTWNSGALEFLATPTARARINISPGFAATGWGADITPSGPGQIQFLSGGLSNLINVTGPGFVGFASDIPMRAFNINFVAFELSPAGFNIAPVSSTNFIVDNVIINAVPEPRTLILFATGAGLFAWARRRRVRDVNRKETSSHEEHA